MATVVWSEKVFFEQVTVKLGEGQSQQEIVQNPEAGHLFRGPKRTQSE